MTSVQASNTLSTADLANAGRPPLNDIASNGDAMDASANSERAPLFPQQARDDFRSRWTSVQGSFIDDPRQAVRQGDELVAEVMNNLAQSFAKERAGLEAQFDRKDGEMNTEDLRMMLRRYRSFFDRLLSL
jgi:hypothetical protein